MYFFYYFPVGINANLRRFPIMTAVYSALCVAIFIVARFFPSGVGFDVYNLIYMPEDPRIVTAIGAGFLHFGYFHLFGNLLYLIVLGRYLEDRFGPIFFTVLYLSSAGLGNYAQGLFNIHVLDLPYMGIIGASGAVSGILGAFTVRFFASKMRIAYWAFMPLQAFTRGGTVEMPVMFAIVLWFIMQVTRGLLQFEGAGSQVAYVTHISGFAWGMLIAFAGGQLGHGRVEALLQKGERYMREGHPYAAQGALIRYLAKRPDHAIVYAKLARAMVLSGNEDGARKHYRMACEMLIDQGHRGAGEDTYREAVRGFPRFRLGAGHQLNLAFGLERNLKPALAITAYEVFEENYPTNKDAPFALLRTAVLYMHSLSEMEKAEACYRRLIEQYPEDQWADFAHEQIRCMTVRRA